jgi:hypothetical protein
MSVPILPEWAKEDKNDPLSGQDNVVPPPDEVKLEGWRIGEKPNRQWWNWFNRQTYECLKDLQEQGRAKTTDKNGVGLFTMDDAIISIEAIDKDTPANYLRATGYKGSGLVPQFGAIQASGLTLGASNTTGNQAISGGGANIIIRGISSKIIP